MSSILTVDPGMDNKLLWIFGKKINYDNTLNVNLPKYL
jgi:hypothetical protein